MLIYTFKLKSNFSYLLIFLSFILEFILQLILIDKSAVGDHISYRNYFNYISNLKITEFLDTDSADYIGSYDYLYNFLSYLFSNFLSFDFFTFIINIVYYTFFVIIYCRLGMVFLLPILPFTFYIVGLQFSAQRLILAILLFGLAYLYGKRKTSLISILAHVQIAPLFLLYYKIINTWLFSIIIITLSILAYFLEVTAWRKFILYTSNRNQINIQDFLFVTVMFLIIIMSLNKKEIHNLILPYSTFIFLIFTLGEARINIIVYIFTLLYMQERIKKISILSKLTLILFISYDITKGIQFINGILSGNSGFDSIDTNLGRWLLNY